MADEQIGAGEESALWSNPRPALMVGVACVFVAYLASWSGNHVLTALPLLAGLLATGIAVSIAPMIWWVPGGAAFVSLLAMMTAQQSRWDGSAVLLFWLVAIFAGCCAVLVMLPQELRRLVVSVAIVFHFAGILTAITAAPPQSWLSGWLWGRVYRPYLQFMYVNNAYHFYSPEPGPATLLWFRVEYEPDDDGTTYYRWVKLPDLDDDGKPVEYDELARPRRVPIIQYTRRLSMGEMTNTKFDGIPVTRLDRLADQRVQVGVIRGIPVVPNMPLNAQYLEPNALSKHWIASYARHVAHTCKHTDRPDKPVTGVKVYRVTHNIVNYREFGTPSDEKKPNRPMLDAQGRLAPGKSLRDPTAFVPAYMGEFEASGAMKKSCREIAFNDMGEAYDKQRDPFLYWIIPILPKPREGSEGPPPYDYYVLDYVGKHAGDVRDVKPQRQEDWGRSKSPAAEAPAGGAAP